MADHPKATIVGENDEGFPIYKCPDCGKEEDHHGCDVLGADEGCLFCNNCHCEFDTRQEREVSAQAAEVAARGAGA